MAVSKSDLMATIVSLCKRRGFIFQSSEIYGGLNGCWDYGPLGVELLNNIKQSWWKEMTLRENIEGLDASILMHPKVWEASGHVENFTDPMVDCKGCKSRYRVDVLLEDLSLKKKKEILRLLDAETYGGQKPDEFFETAFTAAILSETTADTILTSMINCPACGKKDTFTSARQFNLMFKTHIGPLEDSHSAVYLRPETAQGIFVNFLNVQNASRQKIPFGIAQIGKAFRNEINTKNFLFRTREFEQMEMQFFVKPGAEDTWFDYWRSERMNWFLGLGMKPEQLKWHKHEKLAHYAKDAFDIEFEFPFGFGEVEGIHSRTNFDLSRHEEFSGKNLKYFDESTKEHYVPYVIETSVGASRSCMAFICAAYAEETAPSADGTEEKRVVMHFNPKLAPVKAAILPLVNRDGMDTTARALYTDLRKHFRVFYDDAGAIGRRYRRQDEIGTPWCITIDSQTLTDQSVTLRHRDSMQQERIGIGNIKNYFAEQLLG